MAHLIVAGALVRGDHVLLAHRRADRRYYPNCWDVLGGHVEPGETPTEALVRELQEELGVAAAVTGMPSLHVEDHPDRDDGMILDVWTITEWRGEPTNTAEDEHDDLRWVAAEELPDLALAHPAYTAFLLDLLSPSRQAPRGPIAPQP